MVNGSNEEGFKERFPDGFFSLANHSDIPHNLQQDRRRRRSCTGVDDTSSEIVGNNGE